MKQTKCETMHFLHFNFLHHSATIIDGCKRMQKTEMKVIGVAELFIGFQLNFSGVELRFLHQYKNDLIA